MVRDKQKVLLPFVLNGLGLHWWKSRGEIDRGFPTKLSDD